MKIIDLHCDTISRIYQQRKLQNDANPAVFNTNDSLFHFHALCFSKFCRNFLSIDGCISLYFEIIFFAAL